MGKSSTVTRGELAFTSTQLFIRCEFPLYHPPMTKIDIKTHNFKIMIENEFKVTWPINKLRFGTTCTNVDSKFWKCYLDDEASEFSSRSFQVIVNNDFDLRTKWNSKMRFFLFGKSFFYLKYMVGSTLLSHIIFRFCYCCQGDKLLFRNKFTFKNMSKAWL